MGKTILDLEKYAQVYGGVRNMNSATYTMQEFEVSAVKVRFERYISAPTKVKIKRVQLCNGRNFSQNPYVIDSDDLYLSRVYEKKEDFICDNNPINLMYKRDDDVRKYIYEKLGLTEYRYGADNHLSPWLWTWDEEEREAKCLRYFDFELDLLDLKLPDGVYASEEECIKANKKVVKVQVTKVYDVEVDERDLEDVLEDPCNAETPYKDMTHATAEMID